MKRSIYCAVLLLIPMHVGAQDPTAIVQSFNQVNPTVREMEFLSPGREIVLSEDENLQLGYLKSCIQEHVRGGRVVIGVDQSRVDNGRVIREKVQCDLSQLFLSPEQASLSAVAVFRGSPRDSHQKVFGTSPVFLLREKVSNIVIQGQGGADFSIELAEEGRQIDLEALGIELIAGMTYQVIAGDHQFYFSVATTALSGPIPLISRLVVF